MRHWPLLCGAVLLSLPALAGGAFAEPPHRMAPFGATAPKTPPVSAPLASALEAARSSEYARAETELSAIGGAERPTAEIALGRILLEQGRFAEAERVAEGVGGDADDRLLAVALRARVLFSQGQRAAAIHLLEGARDTDGRGGRAVRLLLGQYRIATGHRRDAERPLHAIIDEYNNDVITSDDAGGLAIAGRAAHFLRSPKDANKLFNESERADPTLVDGLLWHAELFLDTYDPGHAEETVIQARQDRAAPAGPRADAGQGEARIRPSTSTLPRRSQRRRSRSTPTSPRPTPSVPGSRCTTETSTARRPPWQRGWRKTPATSSS